MSVAELAGNARLYKPEEAATAARDWLAGEEGAAFRRLRRSDVATLRRAVAGARTYEEVDKRARADIEKRERYKSGTSPWNGLLDEFLAAVKAAADLACAPPGRRDVKAHIVRDRLEKGLNADQLAAFDLARRGEASLEFIDYLVRLHQSKKGENPCPPSPVS